ncbi:MAG: type VII toxin-antitoxin system HepT family RNase toxin, partial [Candidatus Binatia bacterium]
MVDRERILGKLAELEGYLQELRSVAPDRFEDYHSSQKKRSCERLLQIAVEAVIDVCHLLVTGLRLGLPAEENDLFDKLARAGVITEDLTETLKRMKGFRNILVHEYGAVD